ncbi:hypothetical protein G7054_g3012 [Neopestalotiopsis clavispora]|nr:hypothetical protein G7054_g3012 [Neopestalotiopsis clavispora]
MPSNDIRSQGNGPQNIAAGSGDQFSQSGSGTTQVNNSILYAGSKQVEATDELREEREDFLGSLVFDAIYSRCCDIGPAHHGTCDWFFTTEEFHKWHRPTYLSTHNGVMWIKGNPGAGKSMLMKHILEKSGESVFSDHIIAAHFFNAQGEALERTGLGMLRSLVYQLLQSSDVFYQHFVPRFREKQRAGRGHDWQWRESELKEFLRSVSRISGSPPLLLLIDALDECGDSDVRRVVEFLESLSINASQAKVQLKICLSSRHYPSIRMGKMLEFAVERSTGHQMDISKYLTAKLRITETSLRKEVLTRANGIFLWVVLVVSLLNRAYDEGRVEEIWQTLNKPFANLEKIVSATLGQKSPRAAETMDMLQWVLLSIRPLEPRELFAAVAKTAPPPDDAIERRIITAYHAERVLAKSTLPQNVSHGVDDWDAAYTSNEKPIRKWLRDSNNWLIWWKLLIIAAGSDEERRGLESEEEVGLVYVVALRSLPNLCRAALHGLDVNSQGGYYGTALQAASYGGHIETINLLLQEGAKINTQSGYYGNALQAASYRGHIAAITLLLDKGANINAEGGHYGNALQAASCGGQKEAIDLLVRRGANVNAQGGHYGYALQAASYEGHRDVVELLLQRGADIDAQSKYYGFALQAAALKGHQDIIELLLQRDADIDAQGGHYGHALQAASYEGHQHTVELLLQEGANIHVNSGYYGTALQAASYGRSLDLVELLIDQGADVNAPGGYFGTALQAASNRGHRKIVKLLLDKNADVNLGGGHFGNALQAASVKGYRVILEMLMQKGANVSAHGGHFGTALQAASFGGSPATIKFLLEKGANVLTAGGKFGHALQAASREGHPEVVQLLVEAGADCNAQGGKYGNALQAAASRGHEDIIEFLLNHGADVNALGGKYGSALQAAASRGYEDIVKFLLDLEASVNARGGKHGNALQAAKSIGDESIERLLLERGAIPHHITDRHRGLQMMKPRHGNTAIGAIGLSGTVSTADYLFNRGYARLVIKTNPSRINVGPEDGRLSAFSWETPRSQLARSKLLCTKIEVQAGQ